MKYVQTGHADEDEDLVAVHARYSQTSSSSLHPGIREKMVL